MTAARVVLRRLSVMPLRAPRAAQRRPTRVVEVIAGERRAPIRQHPREPALRNVGLHVAFGQVASPKPFRAPSSRSPALLNTICPSTRTLSSCPFYQEIEGRDRPAGTGSYRRQPVDFPFNWDFLAPVVQRFVFSRSEYLVECAVCAAGPHRMTIKRSSQMRWYRQRLRPA
jgi:hypothetical protein